MPSLPHRSAKEIRKLAERLRERGLLGRLSALCHEYNVDIAAVLRGERTTRVVHARDACIYRLLQTPMSSPEAGALMGMDHASILVARDRYLKRDNGRLLT